MPLLKITLLLNLFLTAFTIQSKIIILTGEIKTSDNQYFYAPSKRHETSLQWVIPEGQNVKKGDLIAIFNGSEIESQLKQQKKNYINALEEKSFLANSHQQLLLKARFALKDSQLLLKKSLLDASIPENNRSRYQHKKDQFAYKKAKKALKNSEYSLKSTQIVHQIEMKKKSLTIERLKSLFEYSEIVLKEMSLYAKRSGTMIYAKHPWTGDKIYIGMTLRRGWEVARISASKDFFIEAWVHDVDKNKLKKEQSASLIFDAYSNQKLHAKIHSISTQPEYKKAWGNDMYYRVVFHFSSPSDLKLFVGMSAQLILKGFSYE
jgi:multidrug resistance efflux pump